MADVWTVDIRPEWNPNYPSGGAPLTFDDWESKITYNPSNINYIMKQGSDDASSIAFDIPASDPNLTPNQFGPTRSDFRLSRNGNLILQGLINKVSPIVNDKVQVAGADYLSYLGQRVYPYDYTTYEIAVSGTPPFYTPAFGRASNLIIQDIIDAINATPNTRIVYGVNSNPDTDAFEGLTSYPILPGDTTYIKDHISDIAQQDTQIGFEYYCDNIAIIQLFANRYNVPPSNYITITPQMCVGEPQWDNNGPASTVEIGFGLGNAISGQSVYAPSLARFGRVDNIQLYGDSARDQDRVNSLVGAWGRFNRSPQHDFTVTVYADLVLANPDWVGRFYQERAGVVLGFSGNWFQPFHQIGNADGPYYYRGTTLNFNLSNEGDLLCEITCQQCYIEDNADD